MSLYIRVSVGFFSNRKTLRLYQKIGVNAYWLPPRLWAYAAKHQPDGDFTDYDAKELATLLGYDEDASIMLQALQDAKFLDGMKIHDWRDHNGYHVVFAERAKKAANARWKKERTKERKKYKDKDIDKIRAKHCLSIAQALLQASTLYLAYPKKVGKPDAMRAIQKALKKVPFDVLLARTKAYATARNGDLSFVPNPSTWFNQERYNDDPATWVPSEKRIQRPKSIDPNQARIDEEYERHLQEMAKRKSLKA